MFDTRTSMGGQLLHRRFRRIELPNITSSIDILTTFLNTSTISNVITNLETRPKKYKNRSYIIVAHIEFSLLVERSVFANGEWYGSSSNFWNYKTRLCICRSLGNDNFAVAAVKQEFSFTKVRTAQDSPVLSSSKCWRNILHLGTPLGTPNVPFLKWDTGNVVLEPVTLNISSQHSHKEEFLCRSSFYCLILIICKA